MTAASPGPAPVTPGLLAAVAEKVFDAAHEHCGEDGCTAGGLPGRRTVP